MADGLFPKLPAKLAELSDQEVNDLLALHEKAAGLIDADDSEFLAGLSAEDIIEQFRTGADQIKALRTELLAREQAAEAYVSAKAAIADELKDEQHLPPPEAKPAEDGDVPATEPEATEPETTEPDPDATEPEAEATEPEAEAEAETEATEERVLVTAAAEEKPRLRRPPAPSADRVVVNEKPTIAFVASGLVPSTPPGSRLETRMDVADAVKKMATALGRPTHSREGREDRYLVASLDYSENFPEERLLVANDWQGNIEKIAKVGSPYFAEGREALVASGGFCAPLEPRYSMPQLATAARPVRDALPNYRAPRGGISVPTPTTIGDITTAITTIEEADDALGGTFATKGCQDMDCVDYTDVAVTIIAHCREFGNLNAMAWPEKIAHENELTMAAHARTAEMYLLERIKALSVNVTNGAETLSALAYMVDAIVKSRFGIITRLRMNPATRFTALLPWYALDLLLLDTVQTIDGNRFKSKGELDAYLGEAGIDTVYYMDGDFAAGDDQVADASQAAAAIDGLPNTVQWAFFPSGTFLHLDMAELNLGIVRDSTLNSTNDFQVFGESFENVARIGPAQAAYWITTDWCPVGQFPPAGTARTCE